MRSYETTTEKYKSNSATCSARLKQHRTRYKNTTYEQQQKASVDDAATNDNYTYIFRGCPYRLATEEKGNLTVTPRKLLKKKLFGDLLRNSHSKKIIRKIRGKETDPRNSEKKPIQETIKPKL